MNRRHRLQWLTVIQVLCALFVGFMALMFASILVSVSFLIAAKIVAWCLSSAGVW